MRKFLTGSTALSLALSSFHTLPSQAQTVTEDGSVLGPDGTVLCVPTAEAPCDVEAIARSLAEAAAQAAAAEEAAAAEAAAQAAAAEEAAAAEAAAQAAAAEEAAAAEAAAQDAAAEEAAAAEAAAQAAAAEEAAAAEAAAQAAAAEEADEVIAPPESDDEASGVDSGIPPAETADDTPSASEPETASEPISAESEPATPEEQAAESAVEPTVDAVTEGTGDPVAETAVPDEAGPEVLPGTEATTEPISDPVAQDSDPQTPSDESDRPVTEAEEMPPEAEVVDIPEVPEEAAASLESLLTAPDSPDAPEGGVPSAEGETETAQPAAVAAEVADAIVTGDGGMPTPEVAPVAVVAEVVSEETTRSSAEEFAAAPVAVADGKKSGLSDLEKVGLLALGALVVGAIINEGTKEERKVVSNTGDRVVVENPDGTYVIYKDDDAVLRRPGVRTVTETYRDGSTRTVVQRADGTEVVTIRDASGRVLRRTLYDRDGREIVLIDDFYPEERIEISELPKPREDRVTISTDDSDAALKAELAALEAESLGRKFSLRQIRDIREVRALAATIEVDSITFDTGSAAIKATEARKLADIGRLMQDLLDANPAEVFLIEGHTDAVGSAPSNLALSDRRAESLALALTEYFDIPPENLVVQGYGEAELKVDTQGDERANRRVVVRLITPLMRVAETR